MATNNIAGFFIPHTKQAAYETSYEAIIAAVKHQFNWRVADRRIRTLTYTRDKKQITATVGEQEQFEDTYHVVAILESNLYIVATKSPDGQPGPTILVGNHEVVEVIDF